MIRRNDKVVADEVDGTTMLCDTESVQFFRLNSTGRAIWDACDDHTVGEIVRRLSSVYSGVDADILRKAVQVFVKTLSDAGLVTIKEDAS